MCRDLDREGWSCIIYKLVSSGHGGELPHPSCHLCHHFLNTDKQAAANLGQRGPAESPQRLICGNKTEIWQVAFMMSKATVTSCYFCGPATAYPRGFPNNAYGVHKPFPSSLHFFVQCQITSQLMTNVLISSGVSHEQQTHCNATTMHSLC